jgi:hypothetical protein
MHPECVDTSMIELAETFRFRPIASAELCQWLDDVTLAGLAAAVRSEQQQRALANGDQDAIIDEAFEIGFIDDGMAVAPWVRGPFVVSPSIVLATSASSHTSRLINVDDTWVWNSNELVREDKRSSAGRGEGFRAVALLPIIEAMRLDQVTGRQRQGMYEARTVVSFEVRGSAVVEVAQRNLGRRDAPRFD